MPEGWVNTGPGDGSATDWEVGNPLGGATTGPSAAANGTFCAGTNIAANYTVSADVAPGVLVDDKVQELRNWLSTAPGTDS